MRAGKVPALSHAGLRPTPALLAAAALAASLAACGGAGYVRVRGVAPLNVDGSNQSTPVDQLERAWADAHPLVTVPAAESCADGTCAV